MVILIDPQLAEVRSSVANPPRYVGLGQFWNA